MKPTLRCEHGKSINEGGPACLATCGTCGHNCDMHVGGCRCGCAGFIQARAPGPKLATRNARKRERRARR